MSEPRSYAQGYLEAQAKYEAELAAYKDQLAATNRELEGLSARYDAADLERCQLRGECALLKQQLDAERAKVNILESALDDEREKVTFYRDREVK